MLRVLLFAHLLVVPVGPRPCPCAAPRGETTPPAASVRPVAVPRPCGCCVAGSLAPENRTGAAQRSDRDSSGPCQCSCGEPVELLACRPASRSDEPDGTSGAAPGDLIWSFFGYPIPSEVRPTTGWDTTSHFPFRTTEDFLYVFHFLRC